jgi:hypothetical protein
MGTAREPGIARLASGESAHPAHLHLSPRLHCVPQVVSSIKQYHQELVLVVSFLGWEPADPPISPANAHQYHRSIHPSALPLPTSTIIGEMGGGRAEGGAQR